MKPSASETLVRPSVATEVSLPIGDLRLTGELTLPAAAQGIVLFAHGSGSSRLSPRNQFVARRLQSAGLGTLLFDLLTPAEERKDQNSGFWRFDINLLAQRLIAVTRWLLAQPATQPLAPGYFGSSTGAAAALVAAAELGTTIRAVVSRGGRPDLAGEALHAVTAPTLLIVGEADAGVLSLNQQALRQMTAPAELTVVPRATHLFQEPGALSTVSDLAARWFQRHLAPPPPP
jgi:dienelactone hydrolase